MNLSKRLLLYGILSLGLGLQILPEVKSQESATRNVIPEKTRGTYLEKLAQENSLESKRIYQNHLRTRDLEITIALDGVGKNFAREIVDFVSEEYQKTFNIAFKNVFFVDAPIEDSILTNEYLKKMRDSYGKKGDIFLLFTQKDWEKNYSFIEKNAEDTLYGEAFPVSNYGWVETCHNKKKIIQTTIHEIAHLFGAEDNEEKGSIMHSTNFYEKIKWDYWNWRIILSNKFKKFECGNQK